MRKASRQLLVASALLATPIAHAGRPLNTDDASTVGDLHYQVEAWRDHGQDLHSWTLAPAVGYGEWEFGLGRCQTRGADSEKTADTSIYVKWAPAALTAGPLRFGAKAWTVRGHDSTADTLPKPRENGAFAIASWDLGHQLFVHTDLGMARNRVDRRNERISNLAASWAPHERVLLFIEALKQQHSPTQQAAGVRWWAITERLGIDLTVARQAGQEKSVRYGIGFGWYGSFTD